MRILRRQKRWQNIWKIVGLMQNRICLEEKSTSTYENLKKSLAFIDDERRDKIGIVTNNFHIYRSCEIGKINRIQKSLRDYSKQ